MRRDVSLARVKAMLKRLFAVALHLRPAFVCGALILLARLLKEKVFIRFMHYREEEERRELIERVCVSVCSRKCVRSCNNRKIPRKILSRSERQRCGKQSMAAMMT